MLHQCLVVGVDALQVAARHHVVNGHFDNFGRARVDERKPLTLDHHHAFAHVLDHLPVALFRAVQCLGGAALVGDVRKECQGGDATVPWHQRYANVNPFHPAVRQQEPDFVLAGYVFARQPPLAAILHR